MICKDSFTLKDGECKSEVTCWHMYSQDECIPCSDLDSEWYDLGESDIGYSECELCSQRKLSYSEFWGAYLCTFKTCPTGYFNVVEEDLTYCTECSDGYGYFATSDECNKCSDTATPRIMSGDQCILLNCSDGYYRSAGNSCIPCPDGNALTCGENGYSLTCKTDKQYVLTNGRCIEDKCVGIEVNSCQNCYYRTGEIYSDNENFACLDANNEYGICTGGICFCPEHATCTAEGAVCDENYVGGKCDFLKCTDFDHGNACPNGQFCFSVADTYGVCVNIPNETVYTDGLGGKWAAFSINNLGQGWQLYNPSQSFKSLCLSAGYTPATNQNMKIFKHVSGYNDGGFYGGFPDGYNLDCTLNFYTENVQSSNIYGHIAYNGSCTNYGSGDVVYCAKDVSTCSDNSDCSSGEFCEGSDNIARCIPLQTGGSQFSYNGNNYILSNQTLGIKGVQNWCTAQGYIYVNPESLTSGVSGTLVGYDENYYSQFEYPCSQVMFGVENFPNTYVGILLYASGSSAVSIQKYYGQCYAGSQYGEYNLTRSIYKGVFKTICRIPS